ncbi:tail protein [Gordonia phage Gibbin]|uniref:Esterase n=1 Tax=Gordonia phage Gibbin TaxID=2599843 RepID=A0A5J6TKN0_9CAUD|nr:tail protein [Gordonia phage Gibbin]QFG10547.1 esterase [Gordonia phage Gibbin]
MANVWYIGDAQTREITLGGQIFTWNVWNGWSIPESAFTSGQLAELDADPGFLLGQTGPRALPPWTADPVTGRESVYLQTIKQIVDTLPAQLSGKISNLKLIEDGDVRVPLSFDGPVEEDYLEVFVDLLNRLSLGIRKNGSVEIPRILTKSVEFMDGNLQSFPEDRFASGTVDAAGRVAEDAIDQYGRKPDWILSRWKSRMAALSGASTLPMDIIVGGGQSNMGSTSDTFATGVDLPPVNPNVYLWNNSQIVRIADMSESSQKSFVPRAIYAFADEYARKYLKPGRAVLIVNSGVGSSGFSTTTISPAPSGYKNVLNGDNSVNQNVGTWEVQNAIADPVHLYGRMITATKAAKAAAPAGSSYVAFLWSQGESDTTWRSQAQYSSLLDELIAGVRSELGVQIPALIGSMNPNWVDENSNRKDVQTALEDTPRRVEKSAYAFGPYDLGDLQSNIHWAAQGQLARGPIFLSAYDRARWNVAATEPQPPQNLAVKRYGPNIQITWEHPPCGFTSFTLEHKIDSGSWTAISLPANSSPRSINVGLSLTASQVVSIRMRTVNSVGTSGYTREVLA